MGSEFVAGPNSCVVTNNLAGQKLMFDWERNQNGSRHLRGLAYRWVEACAAGPGTTLHPLAREGKSGSGCRLTRITVVESANQGQFNDFTGRAVPRNAVAGNPVPETCAYDGDDNSSDSPCKNAAQMFLVETMTWSRAFPAEGADQAFNHRVLPR